MQVLEVLKSLVGGAGTPVAALTYLLGVATPWVFKLVDATLAMLKVKAQGTKTLADDVALDLVAVAVARAKTLLAAKK